MDDINPLFSRLFWKNWYFAFWSFCPIQSYIPNGGIVVEDNLLKPGEEITTGKMMTKSANSLRWRHNGHDSVSNHQPHDCLLTRLFRRRSKKTSKLRVTGLWAGKSPGTGEFPAQMASDAENVSIWWRLHVFFQFLYVMTSTSLHFFFSVRSPMWRNMLKK